MLDTKLHKQPDPEGEKLAPWRESLHTIIFGAETPLGRAFDITLIISIIVSVLAVMLGTVASISLEYGELLLYIEWFFTLVFTAEYALRLLTVRRPLRYLFSFSELSIFFRLSQRILCF